MVADFYTIVVTPPVCAFFVCVRFTRSGYGVCSPAPHAEPSSPNSSGQNLEARPATVTSSSVLPEVWLPGVTAADPFASVDETRGAVPDCQREHQTQQSISSPVPVSAEHAEDSLSVVSLAKGASSKAASGSDDIEEEKESLLKFLVNLRVLLAFVLQRLRVPPQSVYLSANKLAAGPIIEVKMNLSGHQSDTPAGMPPPCPRDVADAA